MKFRADALVVSGAAVCLLSGGSSLLAQSSATSPPTPPSFEVASDQIAKILELPAPRVVVNRTRVTGMFSFELEFTPGFPTTGPFEAAGASDRPVDTDTSLFTAVQEQLGLRLASQRGPVDVLVIDRVDRPTPD